MAGIVRGVLGGDMVWPFVIAGMVLAIVLILIDLPVLPVAIGIYLPFTLAVPIFGGGLIRAFTNRHLKKKYGSAEEEEVSDWELAIKDKDVKPKEKVIRTGLLLTAGFIAGYIGMESLLARLLGRKKKYSIPLTGLSAKSLIYLRQRSLQNGRSHRQMTRIMQKTKASVPNPFTANPDPRTWPAQAHGSLTPRLSILSISNCPNR
jgi:hypothetical protein